MSRSGCVTVSSVLWVGSDSRHWRMRLFFFASSKRPVKTFSEICFPVFLSKTPCPCEEFWAKHFASKTFLCCLFVMRRVCKAFTKDKNNSRSISLVGCFMHHRSLPLTLSFLLRLCAQVETVTLPFCKTRKKRPQKKRVSLISFSFVNANELN